MFLARHFAVVIAIALFAALGAAATESVSITAITDIGTSKPYKNGKVQLGHSYQVDFTATDAAVRDIHIKKPLNATCGAPGAPASQNHMTITTTPSGTWSVLGAANNDFIHIYTAGAGIQPGSTGSFVIRVNSLAAGTKLGPEDIVFTSDGDTNPSDGQIPFAPNTPKKVPGLLVSALGAALQGPIDVTASVTSPPAPGASWGRELGCASGWGYYWVSGGAGATGAFAIHQYHATTGEYLQSFTQANVGSSQWGMRDLAIDEASFKLYGGQENRLLHEYAFTPPPIGGPNGTLTYVSSYTIPPGGTFSTSRTIRALAIDAATGEFYCKDFNTALWRFSIASGTPTYLGESGQNGMATYGLAWDANNNTLWQFDQSPAGGTDAVEVNEVDLAGDLTGRTFAGVAYGTSGTNIAGGCDIFDDGSGTTTLLALHQNTPNDELYVYQLDSLTSCSVVDACTPSAPDVTSGCTPASSWLGTPNVSECNTPGGSDFFVTWDALSENKNCNVLLGKGAPVALAWSAESSRCFPTPYSRTGQQDTGDINGFMPCGGQVGFDVEAYLQGGNPLFSPVAAGETFVVQAWYRDPASSKSTQLTGAVSFAVCP